MTVFQYFLSEAVVAIFTVLVIAILAIREGKEETKEEKLEKCLGRLSNLYCPCVETFPTQLIFKDKEDNWRCSMCEGIVCAKKEKEI